MTNIKMKTLQDCNTELMKDWFESSCMIWADHYSFLLGLSFNTKEDEVWYREHFNMNKIYDV